MAQWKKPEEQRSDPSTHINAPWPAKLVQLLSESSVGDSASKRSWRAIKRRHQTQYAGLCMHMDTQAHTLTIQTEMKYIFK